MNHINFNEHLRYEDGKLYWITPRKGRQLDKEAGTVMSTGYKQLMFNGKHYFCHRIIWQMHYKTIESGFEIDHIDRDITNNKIENLRIVNRHQNNWNRKSVGYSWHKRSKRWFARIGFNKKFIHLGSYDTELDARAAYLRARKKLFKEFA